MYCGTPLTFQAVYNLLSLHFLFVQSLRSARGESIGPFPIFSEHAHPENTYGLQILKRIWEIFKALVPQSILLSRPSSQLLWFVCCLPQLLPIHAATNIYFALNIFNKLPSTSHFLALGSSSAELGKKKASLLCWSSRVPPDRVPPNK